MLIQINTDNHIAGSPELAARIEPAIASALDRFSERITRVEVHLKDDNSNKGGYDKECTLEARLAGLAPIAVTGLAPTVEIALDGALDKLLRAIEHTASRSEAASRRGIGGD
jgi:hypothetical protein